MQIHHDAAPRPASAAHIKAPTRKPTSSLPPVDPSEKVSPARLVDPARDRRDRPRAAAPAGKPSWAGPEASALLARLRTLRDSLPANKNDRAVALIAACIAEGVRTGPEIVSALVHLGFDNRHERTDRPHRRRQRSRSVFSAPASRAARLRTSCP